MEKGFARIKKKDMKEQVKKSEETIGQLAGDVNQIDDSGSFESKSNVINSDMEKDFYNFV